MATNNEINRGYVSFIKSISSKLSIHDKRSLYSIYLTRFIVFIKLLFIPLLFLYGACLIFYLKIKLTFINAANPSPMHLQAVKYIDQFIDQYPMHLYPIVAKSLELAFIKEHVEKVLTQIKGGTVEFAIGDGSLSKRIFTKGEKITAFDLNPYSLVHVKECAHVSQRIVADCLNPPLAPGGASFIVALNLLHHISNKAYTLKKWAQIAPFALFNENTRYWASGWVKPFLLKTIGLKNSSEKAITNIEKGSVQSLWLNNELHSLVASFYETIIERSFLSERIFYLCAIFSSLLFCQGPPTPSLQKKVLNGIFRPITKLLSFYVAKLLIEYDAVQPRDKDTFIIWIVKSKLIRNKSFTGNNLFVCPDCFNIMQDHRCNNCNRVYEEKDGMLFLLPESLSKEVSYFPELANSLGKEHL